MHDLIQSERQWCSKLQVANATHYDSLLYGNIEQNYDIEDFREFFDNNTITLVECNSTLNW